MDNRTGLWEIKVSPLSERLTVLKPTVNVDSLTIHCACKYRLGGCEVRSYLHCFA